MSIGPDQGVQLLSMEDVDRILYVTDALEIPRDWVIVPIDAISEPRETQQPDGKLIIHAPKRERFESWLKGLSGRLRDLELGRVPRKIVGDPKIGLDGHHEPQPMGTRAYLGSQGVVR